MNRIINSGVAIATFTMFVFGCGGAEETAKEGGLDLNAFAEEEGKGDLAKSTKLLEDVPPDAEVKGQFDPRVRTYGYVVEARAGATLTINLEATAGKDAVGIDAGADLDTVLEVHGPFVSTKEIGEKLISVDDTSDEDLSFPESVLEVEQDGKYFIAFTSYNDTGKGDYKLDIACDGTSVQCMRPDFDKPCKKGKQFVQGAVIEGDQSWDKCDVVILENTTVTEGSTVTVAPGVTVKGNFLGNEPFGNVSLNVDGLIQAVGTPDDPIVFTSFVDGRGWGGITLNSRENTLKHVFVENAQFAVRVTANASTTLEHAVLEGLEGTRDEGHDTRGLDVHADGDADLKYATIKKFLTGIRIERSQLVSLAESVIRENQNGIHVIGEGQRRPSCRNTNRTNTMRVYDPKITKSDIINNTAIGILMERDEVFIQIEKSNIADNGGIGVLFQGGRLAEESYIRDSNIIRNNSGTDEEATIQAQSFHNEGNFDLSNNYWGFISDPNLSNTRQGGCSTPINFTGFAPEPIADAGPTKEKLTEPVKQDVFVVQTRD